MQSVQKDVKPGTTHEAKKAKDALQKDPFNMALIFQLGRAYAIDEHWERSVNVLLRGWKRIAEMPDLEVRFDYLMILCQGSLKVKKYKQALSVLVDIESQATPEDRSDLRNFQVLSCEVYAQNGDTRRSLKCFNQAIEDWSAEEFDTMIGVWIRCMPNLKKVGAFDAARSSLMQNIQSDEELSKVEACEKLADIRGEMELAMAPKPMTGPVKLVLFMCFLVVLVMTLVMLHKLESWSLASTKTRLQ